MGKYEKLALHLSATPRKIISITFLELESLLGFDLPQSAKTYYAWWANDKTHVQAVDGWLTHGWSVTRVDLVKQAATFERIQSSIGKKEQQLPRIERGSLNARSFEALARHSMSEYFKMELFPRKGSMPKLFDLVSSDNTVVGDAKFFSMVNGVSVPPAKFSIIAEHVWLLEKSGAKTKFLVFGNDKRVPLGWLKKYGSLSTSVKFYFLGNDGKIEELN